MLIRIATYASAQIAAAAHSTAAVGSDENASTIATHAARSSSGAACRLTAFATSGRAARRGRGGLIGSIAATSGPKE